MKTFLFVMVAALAAAQQFQQRNDFTPAVRLAGSGFFQGSGTFISTSSGDRDNQFQSNSGFQSSSFVDNREFESNPFQEASGFQRSSFQEGNDFQRSSLQGGNDFQSGSVFQRSSLQGGNDLQSGIGAQGSSGFQSGSGFQRTSFQDGRDNQRSSFLSGSGSQTNFLQGNSNSQTSSFQSGRGFLRNNGLQSSNIFQTNQGATVESGSSVGSTFQSGNRQVGQNRFQSDSFQLQNQNNFQQQNQNRFQSGTLQQSSTSDSQNQRFSQDNQFQDNAFQRSGSSFEASDNTINGIFEPLNLPSGASALLGSISTSFSCVDRPYGYYADPDNFCRIFYVCNPNLFSDGAVHTHQYSFMCGEGTVFDQKELTCVVESAATPCQEASNYYIRNQEFGRPQDKQF